MNQQEIIDCVIDHHNRGCETVTISDIAMTLGYNENYVEGYFLALKAIGVMDNNSDNLWWATNQFVVNFVFDYFVITSNTINAANEDEAILIAENYVSESGIDISQHRYKIDVESF